MKHFDICKKCPLNNDKHLFYLITIEDGMFVYKSKNCCLKIPEEEFDNDKNIPEVYMGVYDIIKFTDGVIEPNKLCPYYAEHQLNDWSKK